MEKMAKSFGKKEKILNYASHTYQLTRTRAVGEVMALIRDCQPRAFKEWEDYYFDRARTAGGEQVTKESLDELGERLYAKITEIVIPEWTEAFRQLTLQDCKDYIYELTLVRTFDGFFVEKSVVNDGLAKAFPEVRFEESDAELDHAGDVDYVGWVGERAFGIQIKPVTAQSNFGNYKVSERMQRNFDAFKRRFGGKVFIVFSAGAGGKKRIQNAEILNDIRNEIARLKNAAPATAP